MTELLLQESFLPVTALEYTESLGAEYLLAGEGPFLKIFDECDGLKCSLECLPFSVIHGIKLLEHSDLLLVFGRKTFRFVRIDGHEVKLIIESEVVELNDWILDIESQDWTDSDNYSVVVVTAHNVCIQYQRRNGSSSCQFCHCQVSCILFSAFLARDTRDSVIVASGTVFNQILLWNVKKDSHNKSEPLHVTFTGHEGVIFSVELKKDLSQLVSASDDRTVRIWAVPSKWLDLNEWEEASCLLVLYGHTARVWRAKFLPGGSVISAGEDATCRVWNSDGSIRTMFRGHKGKSIWSLALSRSGGSVATGGQDCSIRTFSLQSVSLCSEFSSRLCCELSNAALATSPVPRAIFLVGTTPLCLTDDGSLLAGRQESSAMSFTAIHKDKDFSGYSIGSLSPSTPPIVALGNIRGNVKLLLLDVNGGVINSSIFSAHCGKVFSLNWCPLTDFCKLLASCGPDGDVVCWEVNVATLEAVRLVRLCLPPSKHRWLGTISLLTLPLMSNHEVSILTGDRRGSLHLYWCSAWGGESLSSVCPVQTLPGVHGPNGVTDSCTHDGHIYTCGRNGECRKYELSADGQSLVELLRFKPVKGMDWLERMVFLADDLLVVGFRGTELTVRSTSQNRSVLSVTCGGGHRSYAINFFPDISDLQRASVLYIKQSQVYYSEMVVHGLSSKSLLQKPFVGLEAISMTLVNSSGNVLIVVGSEDCSICLFKLAPGTEGCSSIKPVLSLQGHTSAVKALSGSWSSDKVLLFSGGGRASLKAWSLQESSGVGGKTEASLESELYLHDIVKKKKAKFKPSGADVAPECRVMSLASISLADIAPHSSQSHFHRCHYVAAGCSDAVIRQYIYDSKTSQFAGLQVIKTKDKCVLVVKCFCLDEEVDSSNACIGTTWKKPLLCSATTDGHVSIYDLGPFLWSHIHHQEAVQQHSQSCNCCSWFKAHQSGINDIAIQRSSNSSQFLMVSGGDDNGLAITCLALVNGASHMSDCCNIGVVWQTSEPSAHSSPVTGIAILGEYGLVVSTSTDQRLNVWRLSEDRNLMLMLSRTHDVADASSLQTCTHCSSEITIIICGVGMQCFKFSTSAISSDKWKL